MRLYSVELQGIVTGEIERDSRRRKGYESENQKKRTVTGRYGVESKL